MTRSACGIDDQPQRLAAVEAERIGRLGLPVADREDAGAHDLGDEGGGVDREPEHQRQELRRDRRAAAEVEAGELGNVEAEAARRSASQTTSGRPIRISGT